MYTTKNSIRDGQHMISGWALVAQIWKGLFRWPAASCIAISGRLEVYRNTD